MCGITAISANKEALPFLLQGLEKLEYRGYDSAGITTIEGNHLFTKKAKGRLQNLKDLLKDENVLGHVGIGHTRWATHGIPSNLNSHPHTNNDETISLVHNGIIENYRELKEILILQGYQFHSETDSEVAAALLNHYYKGDPKEAIKKTVSKLKGTFALVILFEDQPDVIYSIRNVSPIVATICKEGAMLASDLTALCRFTNEYFVVPEYHILELHKDHVVLTDLNDNVVEPEFLSVDWELNSAGKNGYPFYMEKEIMEQPEAIRNTVAGRIVNGLPDFTEDGVPDELFTECDRICVVACGTAMHAGLVAQSLVKSIVHVPMEVELASEFMYSDPVIDERTLVIAVSQSGETIDTLEALKYAKKQGAKCLSVINVKGSSIARESD